MAWLATQPQGPVLAPKLRTGWCLVLRFYAHTEFGSQAWQIDARPRPGVRYRYRACRPGPPAPGERAAFAGEMTRISVRY